MGFFDDIDYDPIEEVKEDLGKIAEDTEKRTAFIESVSNESYYKRGLIKNGEVVRYPKELLRYDDQEEEFVQTDNNWNLSIYEDDTIIASPMFADNQNDDEIKDELESALASPLLADKDILNVNVFIPFKDEDEQSPIKNMLFMEFKGCFQFYNIRNTWKLRQVSKIIYFKGLC